MSTEAYSEESFKTNSNSTNGKNSKYKTLHGTLTYAPVATPSWCTCDASLFQGPLFQGSGTISHMGFTTSDVTSCVVPTQNFIILNVASSCVTLTAADGDELFLDQIPYQLTFDPSKFVYQGESNANVIGGTGSFALQAVDFNTFGAAIRTKLLQDITGDPGVPVPGTLLLIAIGLFGLAGANRRKALV